MARYLEIILFVGDEEYTSGSIHNIQHQHQHGRMIDDGWMPISSLTSEGKPGYE
jgi:hypothetical protein